MELQPGVTYYPGEFSGDSTQLLYLRARYYNPADGRFLSRDTWNGDAKRPMSMNRWMYVEGNTVNRVDPSGHSWCGNSISKRVAYAMTIVSPSYSMWNVPIDGEVYLNTYTAAGIAVQCPGSDWVADADGGKGPGQISDNQKDTEYGDLIGTRNFPRGHGLRCWIKIFSGCTECKTRDELEAELAPNEKFDAIYKLEDKHDQTTADWSRKYMRRRIKLTRDYCYKTPNKLKCDETDIFIMAALAQNGPGFSGLDITDVILPNSQYVDKETLQINWEDYFSHRQETSDDDLRLRIISDGKDYDTKYMLNLFYDVAKELNKHGYLLPPSLDEQRIKDLMK